MGGGLEQNPLRCAERVRGALFGDVLWRSLRDLEASHAVIRFPYDWRRPIQETADKLAGVVRNELEGNPPPVRLLAHGMGGLVVRAMIAGDAPCGRAHRPRRRTLRHARHAQPGLALDGGERCSARPTRCATLAPLDVRHECKRCSTSSPASPGAATAAASRASRTPSRVRATAGRTVRVPEGGDSGKVSRARFTTAGSATASSAAHAGMLDAANWLVERTMAQDENGAPRGYENESPMSSVRRGIPPAA